MEYYPKTYSTKSKILNATLKIISEEGIQNVTIRKIAHIADVNIAAVNYHFGYKEIAINEAMKYVTEQLKDTFKLLENQKIQPIERLRDFLYNYADTAIQFPEIIKHFITQTMYDYNLRAEYEVFLRTRGIELIKETLQQIIPDQDDDTFYMQVFLLLCSLSYPVLLGNKKMADVFSINYSDQTVRHAYVDLLLNRILSN
ncbi:MAG: TetR/AcrR family transcriptional regulator [Syntrophomonadaceae bacterium]|jgi:AcrR family transcriptional regulator